MPDATLHDNHDRCPSCELRREAAGLSLGDPLDCNQCGGSGIIPLTSAEIVKRQAAFNRLHYWPKREAEFAAANRKIRRRRLKSVS